MKIIYAFFPFIFLIASCTEKENKPNIIFVFGDQWRAEAMGYAGTADVKTPNFDKLAKESVVFSNAISTSPVCTPFRAMLLTGQYTLSNGMFMNDVTLDPNSNSLARILGKEGYNTAYLGKWHLDGNGRSAFIPKERRQGFDYWKVLECSHSYNNSKYWGNDDQQHKWDGYDAEAQTQDAIEYIKKQAKSKDPFCLMLSWGPPHAPYKTAPKEFQDLYENVDIKVRPNVPEERIEKTKEILKGYYAHISALDHYMAQLQAAIKESNIEENTIFVFTSDHGDLINSHGQVKKQQIYAESANVPFIIKYPALFGAEGRKSNFLLNTLDILPTLLGMAGVEAPTNLDGEDITDVILGKKKDDRKASLVSMPQPFGQWRRAVGGREFRGIITKHYTYARDLDGPWLLFHNNGDRYQMKNLVGDRQYHVQASRLDELLQQELSRLGDEFLPGTAYLAKWNHIVDTTGTVPYVN